MESVCIPKDVCIQIIKKYIIEKIAQLRFFTNNINLRE